jgi:hypothetical protein
VPAKWRLADEYDGVQERVETDKGSHLESLPAAQRVCGLDPADQASNHQILFQLRFRGSFAIENLRGHELLGGRQFPLF